MKHEVWALHQSQVSVSPLTILVWKLAGAAVLVLALVLSLTERR